MLSHTRTPKRKKIITMETITRTPLFLYLFSLFCWQTQNSSGKCCCPTMCCNDSKYSCLFLFTPWKKLQLTRTQRESESHSLIESGCVSLCGFAYEMACFCLTECLHRFVHSWLLMPDFPPQWSQRSSSFSSTTLWSVHSVFIHNNCLSVNNDVTGEVTEQSYVIGWTKRICSKVW